MFDDKLSNQEIRDRIIKFKYASGFNPSKEIVQSILDELWFHDFYNNLVSDEYYLNILIKYLDETTPKNFDRFKFYKFLFNTFKLKPNKKEMLCLLALKFEGLQTDRISDNDFSELSHELKISLNFTEWLKNNHLVKDVVQDNKKFIAWEHHTITEFLVAEYLISKNNLLEEFEKLSVLRQEGITAFKSSWSGVLRFLLDSSEKLKVLRWILSFLEKNPESLDDNLSEILVCSNINFTRDLKSRTFNLIYDTYFKRLVWIPIWGRSNLNKFITPESYKRLKADIKKWPDKTETFVKRGNVVAIVDGLLEHDHKLIQKDLGFWKVKLLEFINNPEDDGNGVLQRHSLYALSEYKDSSSIPLVDKVSNSTDQLLNEAFMQFCINTNPNNEKSIIYFVEGMQKPFNIYARYGLYKINTKSAIKYFIKYITANVKFWKAFLQHEDIYDKESGDIQIINNINKNLDNGILNLLKKLIFSIFNIDDLYEKDKSQFVRQIVQIVNKKDKHFIYEILGEIKKQSDENKALHMFLDLEEIFAGLLTLDNFENFFKKINELPNTIQQRSDSIVYIGKRINGQMGEKVYKKAISLSIVKKLKGDTNVINWEQKRKSDTIANFQDLLEPSKGKYMPNVFEYYLQNKKIIDEFFKTEQGKEAQKRFINLSVKVILAKVDPKKFKVTIPDKDIRSFNWPSICSYFGDVIKVVNIFVPDEIRKYRQKIIDFIPYAFSDDMSTIMESIDKISNNEIRFVNEVMINKNDDRRYLIPGTYIYIMSNYVEKGCHLPSAKEVLLSFINDKYIPDYEQRSAIEKLKYFVSIDDKDVYKKLVELFNKTEDASLLSSINEILISVFQKEEAINWRFEKIKVPLKFDKRRLEGISHSVGLEELELDNLSFAKPLIELKDDKYLDKFFKLLDYSFEIISVKRSSQEEKEYWEYVNYLWKIVIAFVENLKNSGSFIPYIKLERWISKYSNLSNLNWLKLRVRSLRDTYLSVVSSYDKIKDGVEILNKSNIPASKIAYFIFKSQIVEFELRKLLNGINYLTEDHNGKMVISRKLSKNEQERIDKKLTLGGVISELSNYKCISLEILLRKINNVRFNQERNEFTHSLFKSDKSLLTLSEKAKIYTGYANEILSLIHSVWNEILIIK